MPGLMPSAAPNAVFITHGFHSAPAKGLNSRINRAGSKGALPGNHTRLIVFYVAGIANHIGGRYRRQQPSNTVCSHKNDISRIVFGILQLYERIGSMSIITVIESFDSKSLDDYDDKPNADWQKAARGKSICPSTNSKTVPVFPGPPTVLAKCHFRSTPTRLNMTASRNVCSRDRREIISARKWSWTNLAILSPPPWAKSQ